MPDDATVRVGGTVTFNVNGGSHGIGIYPVSKKRLVKTSMKTSVRVVRASATTPHSRRIRTTRSSTEGTT